MATNRQAVIDELGYLSTSEISKLDEMIKGIRVDRQLDVVILITDDVEGKTSRDFADDFYDYGGYGIGSSADGLLYLINMSEREVWISTTGKAIQLFSDSEINKMVNRSTALLGDALYFEASQRFLEDVRTYSNTGIVTIFNPIYIGIALFVSIALTIALSASSRGKKEVHISTYENPESFVITRQEDVFKYERTTKTKIETSSGGSSTHKGSSGRSHGGGGGRF